MKLSGTTLRLSPSDLSNHLACRHLTALDLAAAQGRLAKPATDARFLDVLQARGLDHEKAYVDSLRGRGLTVIDLSHEKLSNGASGQARQAMASGADAIVQAPLAHEGWGGYADILLKVDRPSDLGAWSYEVADTKLARETRGGTILQLCVYCDVVHHLQGRRPDAFHVVTPGDPFTQQRYRLDDFSAYYRMVRDRLRGAVIETIVETYPEPTPHCDICRWWSACEKRRRADDHLSLVAGIRRMQMAELRRHDITTLTSLARVPVPLAFTPRRGSREALTRVREQARVQLRGRKEGGPYHELLPLETERGLHRLPAPSPGDMFFDLEGDPFAGNPRGGAGAITSIAQSEPGLEFLFGWAVRAETDDWTYEGRWALNAEEEKSAFEAFIRTAMSRLERDPAMHIYHYAPYEPSALKRLMGKYAVCESEVDDLLRAGVLVDLYAITRQALLASVERYSIKDLEPFYAFKRQTPLREASQALRHVEYLLETGQLLDADNPVRAAVVSYNRDDCLSAAALRDWLEQLRGEAIARGDDIPRPVTKPGEESEDAGERAVEVRALMERLLGDVPADSGERSPQQQARWLLAHLLDFHRREDKAAWWEFFRLAALSDDERFEDPSALTGLMFLECVGGKVKTPVHRFAFPPQECDIREGDEVYAARNVKLGKVVGLDRDRRTVDIKRMMKTRHLEPSSLFILRRYSSTGLADSLTRLAYWVADNGIDAAGPQQAARHLLLCESVGVASGIADAPVRVPAAESPLEQATRLALTLNGTVLPVQGPPGSGKTYTGARVICALVRAGKKVGVTAVSHKVIRLLLDGVVTAAQEEGLHVACIQKPKEDDEPKDGVIREERDSNVIAEALQSGAAHVVGGTAWLWASEKMTGAVDVLVVDEAGQLSLANTLAAAQGASSLVLLGDPQQLEQPLQGTHPDGVAVSVLQHVLGEHQTIPADRGLFLAETRRLAPAICAFTSELFYEGRLRSIAGLECQVIDGPRGLTGAGLWFLPVQHEGNQNVSLEEADAVVQLVTRLTAGDATWVNDTGEMRPLTLPDILVVAPYNAQVYALRERLPGARVGTVDRFQGQEAAIVICSMTTSSADEAPRGMNFLYNLNRLNVATSRARCAVVLVASPALLAPECQTPRQMRLANALSRYKEMAKLLE